LSGELGLVPVTGELSQELRARYGADTEGARLWGEQASTNGTIAYFSAYEFGDQGHERAIVWSNGNETLSGVNVSTVVGHFRDVVRIDLGNAGFDVEKYRGETAAEKWAAAAILEELVGQAENPIPALMEALRYERQSKTLQEYVREAARRALATMQAKGGSARP
jgi:hypothetical protein